MLFRSEEEATEEGAGGTELGRRAALSVCRDLKAALYGEADSILFLLKELEAPPNMTGPPYSSCPLSLGVTTSVGVLVLLCGSVLPAVRSSFWPGEPEKEDCCRPCCSGEPKGKGEKGDTLGLPDPSLCLPDPSLSLLLSSSDITTPAASGFTAHGFTDGSCTLFTALSFHRPSWPSSMVRPDLLKKVTKQIGRAHV